MKKITSFHETKSIVSILMGLMFIFTAIIAYRGNYSYIYELTFLSNTAAGLFLFITGILERNGKEIPQVIYLDFAILLFMVFLICMAFIKEFNFSGAVFFLHIINPLLLMAFFLIYIDLHKVNKIIHVLTILIMPVAYLIFAIIFGSITGNYIYFFLNYKEKGIAYSIIFVLVVSLSLVILGYGIFFINRLIHTKNNTPESEK